jgi:hypothetical protein
MCTEMIIPAVCDPSPVRCYVAESPGLAWAMMRWAMMRSYPDDPGRISQDPINVNAAPE